jgi:REP element-mobilizing transposase RayT
MYLRHLPHWRQQGATYFVTFRLNDALPQAGVRALQLLRRQWEVSCMASRTEKDWEEFARETTLRAERCMDRGYGNCYFREPRHAKQLAEALLHYQDKRCFTSCFVVMPNHCHAVMRPLGDFELEETLRLCKGYVARQINLERGQRGAIWEQESYDRIVRDEEHLYRVIQYIGRNPQSAGLTAGQWLRWLHPSWRAAGWGFVDEV